MKKQKSILRRLKNDRNVLIKRDLLDILTMNLVH